MIFGGDKAAAVISLLFQISRLLEYAAAMSSAQEKVTGSSKLDMAGIMAALAIGAKHKYHSVKWGLKFTGGPRSVLHNPPTQ